MRRVFAPLLGVTALAACAAPATQPATSRSSPATRVTSPWVYRVYTSDIESNAEQVQTFVLDEGAGTVTARLRSRNGRARNHVLWTEGVPMRWRLAVSRGPDLRLRLTAADGTQLLYACQGKHLEVAPATAMRTSLGGESGWKQGVWAVATRPVDLQACRAEGDPAALPTELLLAPEPIEHVIADDNCCQESPSLRFVSADGTIVEPRDHRFPQEE
jgi:hypothetical protein